MAIPETITLDVRNWLVGGVTYACPDTKINLRHIASHNTGELYNLGNGCDTATCPNGRAMLIDRVHLVWYAAPKAQAAA